MPTTLLEARRQAQAAGDHDLQKQFRLASAQLLMKYGMAPTGKTAEEFGDVSSSGGSQERESTSGDEEEEGDGNDDDAGEKDDDDDDGAIQDIGMEDEEQTLGGDLQETQAGKSNSLGGKLNEENATGCGQMPDDVRFQKDKWHDVGPLDIPFTIKVHHCLHAFVLEKNFQPLLVLQAPASYHEFTKLVEGRTPEEAAAVISRIRATNALSLSKDNRRRLQANCRDCFGTLIVRCFAKIWLLLQIFYGILVQHFVMLAGQRPLPLRHLDVLATAVQGMTGEVKHNATGLV